MAEDPLRDRFANIATISVTLSAANTVTAQELATESGIQADRKSAVAIAIDQVDFYVNRAALNEMTADGDHIVWGLTISNLVTDLEDITDSRILLSTFMRRGDFGTAAGGNYMTMPVTAGPYFPALITAEKKLFLVGDTGGLASAAVLKCRIYYRTVMLSQAEFVELAEVFRLVG